MTIWNIGKSLAVGVFALSIGCATGRWSHTTAETTSGDVRGLTMHFRTAGSHKSQTILYEDAARLEIRVARRFGSGSSWGNFESRMALDKIMLHASTQTASGSIYIAGTNATREKGRAIFVGIPGPHRDSDWTLELVHLHNPDQRIDQPPGIAVGASGTLHVVWSTRTTHELYHARKIASGEWIVDPITFGDDREGVRGTSPKLLARESDQGIELVFQDKDGRVVRTGIQSGGWHSPVLIDDLGAPSKTRLEAKWVRYGDNVGKLGVVLARSADKPTHRESAPASNETWRKTEPEPPAAPDRHFDEPSFARDLQGKMHISAYDLEVRAPIVFSEYPRQRPWSVHVPWTSRHVEGINLTGERGRFTSMVYDVSTNQLLVAYFNRLSPTSGEIRVAAGSPNPN